MPRRMLFPYGIWATAGERASEHISSYTRGCHTFRSITLCDQLRAEDRNRAVFGSRCPATLRLVSRTSPHRGKRMVAEPGCERHTGITGGAPGSWCRRVRRRPRTSGELRRFSWHPSAGTGQAPHSALPVDSGNEKGPGAPGLFPPSRRRDPQYGLTWRPAVRSGAVPSWHGPCSALSRSCRSCTCSRVATYGEARVQRWRCAARRARELIWTRWALCPLTGNIAASRSGGGGVGARREQAGCTGVCRRRRARGY